MKLYFDPISTPSRAVLFFLHDHGIACDEEVISLASGENRNASFRRINPTQLVPVLDDDGFVLTESAAILQYLADTYAPGTLPRNARERARVIEALDWFAANYGVYCNFFLVYVPTLPKFSELKAGAGAAFERIGRFNAQLLHDVLEARFLDGRLFLCGPEISVADYIGAAHMSLAEAAGLDRSAWPLSMGWLARMRERKGWVAANATFEGMLRAMRSEPVSSAA